jgi:hypothetical protein
MYNEKAYHVSRSYADCGGAKQKERERGRKRGGDFVRSYVYNHLTATCTMVLDKPHREIVWAKLEETNVP